ncbi:MAG: DNRLRE domain-containing protein [Deltaproteobacteria bacterium]|nr:DNRLRE domain-containing protein [Deltaproteobacteria bacterium]
MSGSCRRERRAGFVLLPVLLALALVASLAYLLNRQGTAGLARTALEADSEKAFLLAEAGFRHLRWFLDRSNCAGYTSLPVTALGPGSYSATVSPTSGSPVTITSTGTLPSGTTRTVRSAGVTVYVTYGKVQLQPGPAANDASVQQQYPTANYGASPTLTVDGTSGRNAYALLSFDLSSLPAGAEVYAATLDLYLQSYGGSSSGKFTVRRMARAWVEGTGNGSATGNGATYATADGATAWVWPDNYSPAVTAWTTVSPSLSGWHSWEVAGLVQDWSDGTAANYGLLVQGDTGVVNAVFASGDGADPSLAPKLSIAYRVP